MVKADHYPHMATVKILRLGGERLTHPHNQKKKKKRFGSLPAPQYGYATPIMVFFLLIYFAHLLIAEGPVTQILWSTAYSSPTYAQKV